MTGTFVDTFDSIIWILNKRNVSLTVRFFINIDIYVTGTCLISNRLIRRQLALLENTAFDFDWVILTALILDWELGLISAPYDRVENPWMFSSLFEVNISLLVQMFEMDSVFEGELLVWENQDIYNYIELPLIEAKVWTRYIVWIE